MSTRRRRTPGSEGAGGRPRPGQVPPRRGDAAAGRGRTVGIVLVTSVLLAAALACAGPAPGQAFGDPRVAELANAAVDGDTERVRALTATGVDIRARGDRQVTLLQWALLNRSIRGLEVLLEAGADPQQPGIDDDTVVHLAAMADEPRYLDLLLARGADPDARNATTLATPLVSALRGGREVQFRALLAAGADPGAADRTGNTPLHHAAKVNAPGRVLDLLEAGANPAATTANTHATFQRFLFRTPEDVLSLEARRDREAVREWLRTHGVPIE